MALVAAPGEAAGAWPEALDADFSQTNGFVGSLRRVLRRCCYLGCIGCSYAMSIHGRSSDCNWHLTWPEALDSDAGEWRSHICYVLYAYMYV